MKSVFHSGFLKIQTALQYSAYGKWKVDLFLNKIRFKFGKWRMKTTIPLTLKTARSSRARKWRVLGKRAFVYSSGLHNNGCQN